MAPQANNATAREPSMEEILASIRRIIEDSDSARKVADDSRDEAIFDASADADLGYRDEAAREEASAPEVEAFRSELAEPEPVAAEQPMEPAEQLNGKSTVANGFSQRRLAEVRHDSAGYEAERPEPVRQEAIQPEGQGNARGAIISEVAGRQVAAAFEELSDAFSASRKRSYDEIAEEIMRPMLQDWLDNNLPLLVERLVREEIERVARGGAR